LFSHFSIQVTRLPILGVCRLSNYLFFFYSIIYIMSENFPVGVARVHLCPFPFGFTFGIEMKIAALSGFRNRKIDIVSAVRPGRRCGLHLGLDMCATGSGVATRYVGATNPATPRPPARSPERRAEEPGCMPGARRLRRCGCTHARSSRRSSSPVSES
jgi:hypothetical protein